MTLKSVRNFTVLLALALIVAACGGGGSGGSNLAPTAAAPPPEAPAVPADNTGVVAIALKDAPSDEFLSILVTFTRIELLGDDGPVVIFEGEETFDLLELRNFYDLMVVSDRVPVGMYSKIRLTVTQIELVRELPDGNTESIFTDLPGGGKIDLNPRSTFEVTAEGALLIELDMDANKSIHVHSTGKGSDKYKFRPVVFVDIRNRELDNALVRLHGRVGRIAVDRFFFELCDVEVSFHTDTNGCVVVNVRDETSIFNLNGDQIRFQQLKMNDEVSVLGRLMVAEDPVEADDNDNDDDENDDSDSRHEDTARVVQVDAFIIQVGPEGSSRRLDGLVLSAVNDANQFGFQIAPGQGFSEGSTVNVLLQPGTKIISSDLKILDKAAIQRGGEAKIVGVVMLSDSDPDLLKASLIIVQLDEEPADRLVGTVLTVDEPMFNITGDTVDQCVRTGPETNFFIDTEEGIFNGGFELVAEGQKATVFGAMAIDTCFDAETVFVEPGEASTDPV